MREEPCDLECDTNSEAQGLCGVQGEETEAIGRETALEEGKNSIFEDTFKLINWKHKRREVAPTRQSGAFVRYQWLERHFVEAHKVLKNLRGSSKCYELCLYLDELDGEKRLTVVQMKKERKNEHARRGSTIDTALILGRKKQG